MSRKKESQILGTLLQKIAPEIGATILIEPVWGMVGQITFASGKRSYFRYNTMDLNPVGSSDVAKDKDYANFFLNHLGYPVVPQSKTFFSAEWGRAIRVHNRGIDAGYRHASRIGLPVIVKPNSGSQGIGVSLVHTKQEFYSALRTIFKRDRVALVQAPVRGKDYRIVVLDDEIISAYERIPLNVVGDGRSSVAVLIAKKQRAFRRENRDTRINIDDARIRNKLHRQNLSFESILDRNQRVFLLDNANLSTGGDSIDVTQKLHPGFQDLAVAITKEMGLRLCGVDLMIDSDISKAPETYYVLEINAAPGLDHYVKSGKDQEEIVENLYRKVLRSLDS